MRTSIQAIFEVRTSILAFFSDFARNVICADRVRSPHAANSQRPGRTAGVSLATVDRVLNDRPHVSKRRSEASTKPLNELVLLETPPSSLARNRAIVPVCISQIGDLYLRELLERVEESKGALKGDLIDIDYVQIPVDDAHGVAKYLAGIDGHEVDGSP